MGNACKFSSSTSSKVFLVCPVGRGRGALSLIFSVFLL